MIDNYLDYVKSQRKAALKAAKNYRFCSRADSTKWGQGFYAGHAQARWFESRHWRTLQKDIEAKIADGYDLCLVMSKYPISRVKASLTGGKNGKRP